MKNKILYLYLLIFIIIIIFVFTFGHYKYKIESFNNKYIYPDIGNIIDINNLNNTIFPIVPNISAEYITKNPNDKYITVYPSIFLFPFRNYIGSLYFYDSSNNIDIPLFIIKGIRLLLTNFNGPNNYLFYTTLLKYTIINQHTIYDLALNDWTTGNMKFIYSNKDLKNTYFILDGNSNLIFNNIHYFDVQPINESLQLTGTIIANQKNIVNIKANPNGKYRIKYEKNVEIDFGNFIDSYLGTNNGLYKNYNFIIK